MAIVVAFSGTSGAGKSTLMRQISDARGDCTILQFDDYIELGTEAGDIQGWIDAGAPVDAIETPRLPIDLDSLIAQQPVTPPRRDVEIFPAPLILLEEPFGRARSSLAHYIDHAIHLELPHDLALARRSLRTIQRVSELPDPDSEHVETLNDLQAQFEAYLGPGRVAYQLAEEQARLVSDLVLDARRPLADLAEEALLSIDMLLMAHAAGPGERGV